MGFQFRSNGQAHANGNRSRILELLDVPEHVAKPSIPTTPLAGRTPQAAATVASEAQQAGEGSSTQDKIDAFYGVRQSDGETQFVARFDHARRVQIAGDFNNWSPMSTPMAGRAGEWTTKLPLPKGRYRYRFVVDGKWMTDPHNNYVETNQFGELNNVVEVD